MFGLIPCNSIHPCGSFIGNTAGITRAVLPGVIPTAILSPLAIESVSVASEKAPVVFALWVSKK
jgi:hypothetical protein